MPKGGARQGAGRPKKSQREAALENDITVLQFPNIQSGEASIEIPDYVNSNAIAKDICVQIIKWIQQYECLNLINPQLIFDYAWNRAQHVRCEQEMQDGSMWSKHPTTGGKMISPMVRTSQDYLKVALQIWMQIQHVIESNSETSSVFAKNDKMEMLLSRNGGSRCG